MGRFSRSWAMLKTSFKVVRKDPELMILPIISGIATLLMIASFVGVGFMTGLMDEPPEGESTNPLAYVVLFTFYIVLAFIQVFFYAAMIAGAHERLSGGNPSVGSALSRAGKHFGALFLWSIMVATVNVILNVIKSRSGTVGRMMASITGVAWNLATFFVVPVIMYENESTFKSVGRSANIFKKTWGESMIGQAGFGIFTFLFVLVVGIVGFIAAVSTFPLGWVPFFIVVAIFGLILLTGILAFTVAGAVYRTALYRFATAGDAGDAFSTTELQSAFAHR